MSRLGHVFIPGGDGAGAGRFTVLLDPDEPLAERLEIGAPVVAETREGHYVGVVDNMRVVGYHPNPFAANLEHVGSTDHPLPDLRQELVLADAQVFGGAKARPVRAGEVRAAEERHVQEATGWFKTELPVPVGTIRGVDGRRYPVGLDWESLLGPEAAHLMVGGLSGQASKTSFLCVLLRSVFATAERERKTVGALLFNVKGPDFLGLDRPATEHKQPGPDDLDMYRALGVPAEPFPRVHIYAPYAEGCRTTSRRGDARAVRWTIMELWPYLPFMWESLEKDDLALTFAAQVQEQLFQRPQDPIRSYRRLLQWMEEEIEQAVEHRKTECWDGRVHIQTMRRMRRALRGVKDLCGDLLYEEEAADHGSDIPVTGWQAGDVHVADITGLPPVVQSVVIARTLERLREAKEHDQVGVDHVVVLADELNMYAPAGGGRYGPAQDVFRRIATQGRYAGITLWGAAQKLSKIDDLIRDNAATRAIGTTPEAELASGVYGRLSNGMVERIASLQRGEIAIWHPLYRSVLIVQFPRPAWDAGLHSILAPRGRVRNARRRYQAPAGPEEPRVPAGVRPLAGSEHVPTAD